jgi:ABC-type multidrug transport system permease subunit
MHIFIQQSNNQNIFTIQNEIVNSIKNVTFKYLKMLKNYNQSSFPVIFEKSNFKTDQSSLTDYMAPGIALSVIFFLSVASTASNYVIERQLGLIERSYLAGVKIIELLLSQLIIYSALMLIQIGIVLLLLIFFLEIQLKPSSIPILVSLIFLQGFCGLCYGLCLAALFYDQDTVLQLTIGSFYPILLMSGIIWPIEAQPLWLSKYISKFLPLTYATEAFR